jgi:hypothetical protein
MTGFSFKSIVLQIIQGGVILFPAILIITAFYSLIVCFPKASSLLTTILLGCSFIVGVIVDFFADIIEAFTLKLRLIKPPSYYLLKNGSLWGIRLAHHKKIKENLVYKTKQYAKTNNPKADLNPIDFRNLLFQTAKNIAFKECSDYQKEHLESFFILYVFCRNLAFSIIICSLIIIILCIVNINISLCLFFFSAVLSAGVCMLASYRYFIYYTRMVLGSTFIPSKNVCQQGV